MAALRTVGPLLLLILLGCTDVSEPAEPAGATTVTALGERYDGVRSGTVRGQVRWAGSLPVVPPLDIKVNPFGGPALRQRRERPNPNTPWIDPNSHGVAETVVFLRGINPAQSRSWNHAPVRVEQTECRIQIRQGEELVRFGIARRGAFLEMTALDDYYYALHASGATFFTLSFAEPLQVRRRPLLETGIVELSNSVGYYWMRGYVLVCEHPYCTRTDARGNFCFTEVPPGTYELVCWHPNWHLSQHERDPETGVICRQRFAPPIEQVRQVTVVSQTPVRCDLILNTDLFTQSGKQNGNNRF